MAVVTVQVGQCGNQLGASLFQALHEHSAPTQSGDTAAAAACRRSFFRDQGVARTVIIDTEPKVIQRIVSGDGLEGAQPEKAERGRGNASKSRTPAGGTKVRQTPGTHSVSKCQGGERGWVYDSATQVYCHAQGGAANNWAYGYHVHGSTFAEACVDGVRREAEQCDRLSGLCVLQSAAGGTGSGLGTYLTEVSCSLFCACSSGFF